MPSLNAASTLLAEVNRSCDIVATVEVQFEIKQELDVIM